MARAQRIRFREAHSALQKLIADPEQTERVFEITEALAGRQPQRLLRRVRRAPGGERLLRERPIFDASSCDLEELAQLPAGTFGSEFARWMLENRLDAGLMERESKARDADVAYLGKRLMQVHDFWHVLSGYNRDPIGELGVLAFTFAQSHSRGIGFILLVILGRSLRELAGPAPALERPAPVSVARLSSGASSPVPATADPRRALPATARHGARIARHRAPEAFLQPRNASAHRSAHDGLDPSDAAQARNDT
jgi:ubiquinone biosynthesis protein Coq4